jgi:hypothetical protein
MQSRTLKGLPLQEGRLGIFTELE